MSTRKTNNDKRYFNIISVGGGIFIERNANLCVGSKCCLTIFIVYKINIPKPLYNLKNQIEIRHRCSS